MISLSLPKLISILINYQFWDMRLRKSYKDFVIFAKKNVLFALEITITFATAIASMRLVPLGLS